ncbi:hypothetical protein DDE83_002122 [Stemphylium lycopersici]|uniref:Uncharacterized protein n=1 Tax=Stemphylium lycopersici TaxID=183478 RepID=A0A364NB43_STELY|nr:hypothetical protein DDE83_002122 [Stemphylium lycopersici]
MDIVVFVTHDVTPEYWLDFAYTSSYEPASPNEEVDPPYILVHSLTQDDLSCTPKIDSVVPTQLGSATWEQLKSAYISFCDSGAASLDGNTFLILDQQSIQDRSVIIMNKGPLEETPEGDKDPFTTLDIDYEVLAKMNAWWKYRVPFEDAWAILCGFMGFCTPEFSVQYFIEVVEKEPLPEPKPEPESEEILSQDSTSEELSD